MQTPTVEEVAKYAEYEHCDVLLQCINRDACEQCNPKYTELRERLVVGRYYRAKIRTENTSGGLGWWIPELHDEVILIRRPTHAYWGILLWCPPHFGVINEEQNEDVIKMIQGCKDKQPERVDA